MPDPAVGGPGRTITLDRTPALLPQYLRAVLPAPALPGRAPRRAQSPDGTVLRLADVRVDRAHAAAYAALVDCPASDTLPLLYPHLLGFGMQLRLITDPRFPFPALGLVHLANEVTARRPLSVHRPVDIDVCAGQVREHPRGRVVDLLTTVRDDGDVVWSQTSTYLRRGPVDGAAARTAAERDDGRGDSDSDGDGHGDGEADLHPSARRRLPADLGRRYAAVSGDRNPIHLHPLTARPFGFRTPIVHGMWTAAAVLTALAGRLPDAVLYTVQFRRPVPLPSTIWLDTWVASRPGDPGEVVARARVRGDGQDGPPQMTATVRALD